MEILSIDSIIQELSKWMNDEKSLDILKNKGFLPNSFFEVFNKLYGNLKWKPIENWRLFESGDLDFGEADFKDICFEEDSLEDDKVIILTDELYKLEKVAVFEFGQMNSFIAGYTEKFNQEFFQPLDYILLIPRLRRIVLLQSDGLVCKINVS